LLKEMYYIVVYGTFQNGQVECESEPTAEQITAAINKFPGSKTATVEKRFKLVS